MERSGRYHIPRWYGINKYAQVCELVRSYGLGYSRRRINYQDRQHGVASKPPLLLEYDKGNVINVCANLFFPGKTRPYS